MKFLVLNADYPEFLESLYARHPGLGPRPYEEQRRMRMDTLFGGPYQTAMSLTRLGHEATDIYANNEYLQKAWAREHRLRLSSDRRWEFRLRRGLVPWLSRTNEQRWFYDILRAQITHYRPDVLLNQAMDVISSRFLQEIKPLVRLLVGQHAAPLPKREDFSCYDVFISSLPDLVDYFRQRGIPAEVNPLGFWPDCLSCMEESGKRPFDVTFIGNLLPMHSSRAAFLEALSSQFPQLKIWGPTIDDVAPGSSIRRCYQGFAWGRDMYTILARSKIALNIHGDFAPYANNGRLYETTGMGALLVTDWKENLHELFELDKEVVAYRSVEECAELVRYYLEHNDEREAIARAGQERTLRDHTDHHRAQELVDILRKYI